MATQNTLSSFVPEYVYHKIRSSGLDYPRCSASSFEEKNIFSTICDKCEEFESLHQKQFAGAIQQLESTLPQMDKEAYFVVLDNIIEGGLNWGRVIGLLVFAGQMAVMSVQKGLTKKVDLIVDWTVLYMELKVDPWILNNDGMAGFREFFRPAQGKDGEAPAWKKVASALGFMVTYIFQNT